MIHPCKSSTNEIPMPSPQKKRRDNGDTLAQALISREAEVVHLTHNDLDAVGADAIHRMAYKRVFSIFCSVGSFPVILEKVAAIPGKGDRLSITDLGYQEGIEAIVSRAVGNGWRLEWRDHHRWEPEEVQRIQERVDLLHIDPSNCACGITAWDLCPHDQRAADVARVVCDYDLWKNEEPRAAVLARVLSHEENRTHVRDLLVDGIFTDPMIEEQYRILQQEMEEEIQKSLRWARIYGSRYRIVVAPLYGHPSETAAAIREKMHSDIEILVSRSGRFSVRSVPPVSHRIAREFRGGGHAHAAGGMFEFSLWDRLAFFLLRQTHQFQEIVDVAEEIT